MLPPLVERLHEPAPLLLDGATGTELSRRGVDLNTPSWTARVLRDDPQLLHQIHRDYVAAGAELITANTFRTHARNLHSLGQSHAAAEWTLRAVEIARNAAGTDAYVAGSVAPLEDCYAPQLTPGEEALRQEHQQMAEALARAGVDLILIETQMTVREAVIAAQAAKSTGIPFAISFVCRSVGQLLSGESLLTAWERLRELQPAAFLVNCVPASEVLSHLEAVRAAACGVPLGAYANTGRLLASGSWEATDGKLPAVYAEYVRDWREAGLRLIGGCCGTTPEHISAMRDVL